LRVNTVSHGSLNARKGKTDEQYLTWLKSEIAGSKEMLEKNLGIPDFERLAASISPQIHDRRC
jgi:hypothetical protein